MTTTSPNSSTHPLLTAAQQLAPRIAARSEEIEAARRLPADLAQELAKADLFRMWIPEAYGGHEVHPTVLLEVLETISRADGSTGWCLMIGSEIGVTAAWLPDAAARTIFGPRDAITAGVNAPFGMAERVQGGVPRHRAVALGQRQPELPVADGGRDGDPARTAQHLSRGHARAPLPGDARAGRHAA
ncbi:acyl-CoA dehydrogenase family protein [Hyalangium gracile]|uniref:acyl-CoA dehydrogenase family protein n=1 Tax=Hyalangium gracile TaxID=394092 RepID=UPI001CCA2E6D|nr:acyl-CoA dehydrogenase family protein [Hyalangium gracile]